MKTHPRTFSIVDCPRLVAVVIGNGSFASFTDCTIQRCPMLQNLQIGTPDKCDDYRNRSYAFFNCQTLVVKDLPGLEGVLLGNYAFYHCSSVVFYTLPKLTRIHFGSYACFTSPSMILEKLPELSELVTYDFALFVCSSVKAIDLMKLDSVEIGLNSFYMLDKVEKKNVNLKLQLELPKMAKYKERIHYK